MNSEIPLDAQVQSAQLEDALSAWQQRSQTSYVPQTAAQASHVVQLYGDLIDTFRRLRDRVNDELVDYMRRLAYVPTQTRTAGPSAVGKARDMAGSHGVAELATAASDKHRDSVSVGEAEKSAWATDLRRPISNLRWPTSKIDLAQPTHAGPECLHEKKGETVAPTSDEELLALRVGVLCGGDSPERAGSLVSGKTASEALSQAGYSVQLVDLAEVDLHDLDGHIDVALLALHGPGGEDGKIQGALDTLGLPYTGSGVMASAMAMHKSTCKELVHMHGMDTPAWSLVTPGTITDNMTRAIGMSIGFPAFLKPTSGGGSLAARLVRDEDELRENLLKLPSDMYGEYLIEEYVPGTPCTVGVLEVDGALSVLPVLDVETGREFYDYTAKHDPEQRVEHCPSILPDSVMNRLQQYALRAHRLIGAHGVSRVDFIVAPNGRTPLLEVNTVPGLSESGNMATMAAAAGYDYTDLIVRILATAFTKPAYLP